MNIRCATFNVLADAYVRYGSYGHVDPKLMRPGARLKYLVQQINNLGADIIGLQEVDRSVAESFEDSGVWQTFWTPRENSDPDGCLTLVKRDIAVADYRGLAFDDGSGYVFQITKIGKTAFANTHIKWAAENDNNHIGVRQIRELTRLLDSEPTAAILADCNSASSGRVRRVMKDVGYLDLVGETPTAFVDYNPVSVDTIALRGLAGSLESMQYDLSLIPSELCASDHVPVVAEIIAE